MFSVSLHFTLGGNHHSNQYLHCWHWIWGYIEAFAFYFYSWKFFLCTFACRRCHIVQQEAVETWWDLIQSRLKRLPDICTIIASAGCSSFPPKEPFKSFNCASDFPGFLIPAPIATHTAAAAHTHMSSSDFCW